MDNTTLFVIVFFLLNIVTILYGYCTYYVYNEYRFINKESSGEVPKSISFMLYYALIIFFSVILTILALIIPGSRAATAIVALFFPVSVTALLLLAFAIREFAKSFPGQKVVMYSKILVILLAIVLVTSSFTSSITLVTGNAPEADLTTGSTTDAIAAIITFISLIAIVMAPIMMAKLRSQAKGSLLASSLKFLIIGFAINSFFGTTNYLTIGYLTAEHDSVGDYSAFSQLYLLFARSMAFFGFYLIYKSIREISGYFKGFGKNEDRGDSASTQ